MANRETLFSDLLNFLKDLISTNITDPISSTRSAHSRFVVTSYPEREVQYPLITLQIVNSTQNRAGMQSTAMDIGLTLEIRIWSKSVGQSDKLAQNILDLLADKQFTVNGSIDNDFHDYNVGSVIRVDEPGKGNTKSRIIQLNYSFFNVS